LRENHANSKCVARYWKLRQEAAAKSSKSEVGGAEEAALFDLVLFCSLSRQYFNRRQAEKNRVFKEAMGFLMSYAA